MTPLMLFCRGNCTALLLAICSCGVACSVSVAEEFSEALQTLGRADVGTTSQINAQRAWQAVTTEGTAERIPEILAAMKEVGPLADNWLRAAVDTIAEREFLETGSLPTALLESFTRDRKQAPRARRIAYEWLAKVDDSAPERLLPEMLDDPSLELRYDAVAYLLAEVGPKIDSGVKLKKYHRILRSARDQGQLKMCAEALKEFGQKLNMAKHMGFLIDWRIIGPFDNAERAGFDRIFPPERAIDLEAEYDGKSSPVKWKDAKAEQEDLKQLGYVDLNAVLVEEKSVLAYAFTTFDVAEDMQIECRYETLEATKLWINGEEIVVNNVYHSGNEFDQYIVPCKLRRGENRILIKVCQNEQTESWTRPWEFRLRITDKLGGAIQQAE